MKSRTSFFNATVLRKDITRFAPLWGLYLVGMLLMCWGGFFSHDVLYSLAETMGATIGVFSIFNFAYALVCAELLFGDLFNSRLCNALHAMPLRRESWFVTHLLSGMLFSVVPNLVVALCLMPRLGSVYWFVSFIWLGGMTITYLFFFGAAVLSAMCTGSRFAMVLVYGLINFLSILVLWVLKFLYEPLLYGIEINSDPFIFLSPVFYLCTTDLCFLGSLDKLPFTYDGSGWPYLAGIAVVGVVLLIAALLLYRRRHLESAGDFITVRFLSPVFHVLYTLAAGMAVFLCSYIFGMDEDYLFLAVGIVAGFLTGQMLLKRTVKVFKPSTFIGLAVTAAVLFGSMGLTKLDVFDAVRWTPEPAQVASVSIRYNYDEYAYTAASGDEIEELMDIHKQIIDTRSEQAESWRTTTVQLEYTLRSGRAVTRRYQLDYNGTQGKTIGVWFSKPEYVLKTADVASLPEKVKFIEFTNYDDGSSSIFIDAEAREMLEAIIADCEAGTMVQDWNYHNADGDENTLGDLVIELPDNKILITLWDTAYNTMAWLDDHGAMS